MFCESRFWNSSYTWDTDDPDFTSCFQKTAIIWTPCFYLLLGMPLRLLALKNVNRKEIKIAWLFILRLVLSGLLALLYIMDLVNSLQEHLNEQPVPVVDFISPLILTLSMFMYCFVLNYERKKAMRTSGFLFFFWLLLLIADIVIFRSKIRVALNEGEVEDLFRFVTFFTGFPVVVAHLGLTLIVDDEPPGTITEEKPCPERSACFLSQITFWWFSSMVVQGYKRPLVREDLFNLNPEDKAGHVVPKLDRHWQAQLRKYRNQQRSTSAGPTGDIEMKTRSQDGQLYTEVKVAETPKKTPSLLLAMVKGFGLKFLLSAFMKLLYDVLQFASPLILKLMIKFTRDKSEYLWKGYFYAALLFIVAIVQSIILHQYFNLVSLLGMRLRASLIDAVYRKMLKLSNAARRTSTVGEIVNLMSVDTQRFMDIMTYLNTIWSGPLQILLCIYFLWVTLGPSILAGVGILVLLIPINAVIANKFKDFQVKQMRLKDSRIKMMNEILNGIKVLKLYAWEASFMERILGIRNKELSVLRRMAYLNACTTFTWTVAPFAVSLVTFAVYVLSDEKNILDADKAFVSLSLFNILRFPMSMLPNVISQCVQASVSLKRLRLFLSHEELDLDAVSYDEGAKHAISINDGSFLWDKEEGPVLRNINLQVPDGHLVAVVGSVGSGKSSLLSAILGEMEKLNGKVTLKGSVSYVAQQAWIQNTTLQGNILFGKKFDLPSYRRVIEACALQPDLDMMPTGDQTEIGEKGINLSGGQKQRVSVARAVYQDNDVYLLDDPLSAVDSHVGRHIFDNVLGPNGLLRNKTRILVTHGISFLPQVDLIVVLVNGQVSEIGSYQELMGHAGAFAEFLKNYLAEELEKDDAEIKADIGDIGVTEEMINQLGSLIGSEGSAKLQRQVSVLSERLRTFSDCSKDSTSPPGTPVPVAKMSSDLSLSADSPPTNNVYKSLERLKSIERMKSQDDVSAVAKKKPELEEEQKLIKAEGMETGKVKLAVFMVYVKAVGVVLSILTVLFYVLYNVSSVYSNIWLSEWSNDANDAVNGTIDTAQRDLRLGVYGALGVVQGIVIVFASIFLRLGNVQAGKLLHRSLLQNVLSSPMVFFDTTPLGRILNRFGRDIDVIDVMIPENYWMWLHCLLEVLSVPVVICYSTPIFLVPAVPLAVFYIIVQFGVFDKGQGAFITLGSLLLFLGNIRAGRSMHQSILRNVVASPMAFFDATPIGRILNRFGKDIDVVDSLIATNIQSWLYCLLRVLSVPVIVGYSTPVFLAIAVPLAIFYVVVQRFYVATSRQLKRLESVSRSPIYSHFGETVTGVTTIRAYGQQERFVSESEQKVDENQICHYPTIIANRWLAVRLEFVGNCIVFFATLFAVIGRDDMSPGIVGLSITYALSVTQTLNWMVRMTTELETNVVAVERVKEYTETPTEAPWVVEENRPDSKWPQEGQMIFDNYGTRYREGLDLVIKGINCTIKPGEKVGIVGRTGAGKSSLTMALFRIIEPALGTIKIDNVDITKIGLHDLRGKLTIIPQEPVLFSGSLRLNLDPFDKYSDDEVWRALEHAHLKTFVAGLTKGLEYECAEGGENLSVGQRQLVCLARALLRKTKVLILDEATAAVDLETDDLIQKTIREEFKDCTILTIAHRLNTILDYTRILVLDAGNIAEFDTPQNLLEDHKSVFYGMARDANLA